MPSRRRSRWLLALAALPIVIGLPFVLLVRGGMWLHLMQGWPAWLAVAGGAAAAALALTAYGTAAWWWISRRVAPRAVARWIAVPVVTVFCLWGIVTIAPSHVKGPDVRDAYAALHPLLRMAVSVWVLADGETVVTDARRTPERYAAMELPAAQTSRHYRQSDGWVHAADLRTLGRGRLRNLATDWYFRLMGFRTLRHVGTADHLHVSLPAM